MPYLHCQSCRLTLYERRMFSAYAVSGTCPRCSGKLDRSPAALFRRAPKGGRRFERSSPAAAPRQASPKPTPLPQSHA